MIYSNYIKGYLYSTRVFLHIIFPPSSQGPAFSSPNICDFSSQECTFIFGLYQTVFSLSQSTFPDLLSAKMYSIILPFLLSLPLLSLAGHGSPSFGHKRHRTPLKGRSSPSYTLEDMYRGKDFLYPPLYFTSGSSSSSFDSNSSQWTFYSSADPTDGLVNYLDSQVCLSI